MSGFRVEFDDQSQYPRTCFSTIGANGQQADVVMLDDGHVEIQLQQDGDVAAFAGHIAPKDALNVAQDFANGDIKLKSVYDGEGSDVKGDSPALERTKAASSAYNSLGISDPIPQASEEQINAMPVTEDQALALAGNFIEESMAESGVKDTQPAAECNHSTFQP